MNKREMQVKGENKKTVSQIKNKILMRDNSDQELFISNAKEFNDTYSGFLSNKNKDITSSQNPDLQKLMSLTTKNVNCFHDLDKKIVRSINNNNSINLKEFTKKRTNNFIPKEKEENSIDVNVIKSKSKGNKENLKLIESQSPAMPFPAIFGGKFLI